MGTKIEDSFIICDTCFIRMGPKYLANKFFDFGHLKICPMCFEEIFKYGFIRIKTGRQIRILTSMGKIIEFSSDDEDSYIETSFGSNKISNLDKGLTPISQRVHS